MSPGPAGALVSSLARMHRPSRSRAAALGAALAFALALQACGGGEVEAAPERDDPDAPLAERFKHLEAHNSARQGPTRWDGRMQGLTTLWHPNGVKAGEGLVVDDLREGPWTFWYDTGARRWEGTFSGGVSEGRERAWHENGVLRHDGVFSGAERDGPYRSWHDNGRPWQQGTYDDGRLHGEYREWRRDGTLDLEASGVYRNGRKVKSLPEPSAP